MAKIESTYDYSRFKFYKFNRNVTTVKRLVKSIKEKDFTPIRPILVNREGYIIDGQHRFEACRMLKKPIYYLVCETDCPEKMMTTLNTVVRGWRMDEWLNYYANRPGYDVYKKLRRLMDENKISSLSNAIVMFSQGQTNATQFKAGKLKDKSEYFIPIANFIHSVTLPAKTLGYRPFIVALKNIFVKYYNTDGGKRKIAKLQQKIAAMSDYRSAEDYEMAMERFIKLRR